VALVHSRQATDLDVLRREVLRAERRDDQAYTKVAVTRRIPQLGDDLVASGGRLRRERSKVFFDLGSKR
jgi:hypothetical protein